MATQQTHVLAASIQSQASKISQKSYISVSSWESWTSVASQKSFLSRYSRKSHAYTLSQERRVFRVGNSMLLYHEGSILRATVVKYSPSNPMLSHVQTEVGRIFMANVSALRRNIQGTCEVVEVESSGSEVPRTTFDSSSQKPYDAKDLSAKGSTCPSSEDSSGDPPLNKLVELACNEAAKDNTS